MAFVLELSRSLANERIIGNQRAEATRWVRSTDEDSIRVNGRGHWLFRIIRWDGESVSVFIEHKTTGETKWWRPPVHPPAWMMRYADPVDKGRQT